MTDVFLGRLPALLGPTLRSLDLSYCPQLGAEALVTAFQSLPKLEQVSGCPVCAKLAGCDTES